MDYFARFGLAPRPWLDGEELKDRFLELSSAIHQDKALTPEEKAECEERFALLNQSAKTLQNTRARLLYLLELGGVPKPEHVQTVPAEVLDLFPVVAELIEKTEKLLREKAKATSPMIQMQVFERALEWTDKIQEAQGRIRERIDGIEEQVREIDRSWRFPGPEGDAVEGLAKAAAALGFLERWNGQLQERLGALTF